MRISIDMNGKSDVIVHTRNILKTKNRENINMDQNDIEWKMTEREIVLKMHRFVLGFVVNGEFAGPLR